MEKKNTKTAKFPLLWWRDAIAKLIFLYVVLQFLRQLYSIYKAHWIQVNPILPEILSDYIAFPHYFFICYWVVAVFLFCKFTKDETLQLQRFWVIPLSLVAFLFGNFFLYLFLMKINPYG